MGVIVTQIGDRLILDTTTSFNVFFQARLFRNDIVPTPTSVFGDFIEANFGGYSTVVLAWAAATINPLGKGQMVAASITFTCDGTPPANTIFGIYVHDQFGAVTFAERFPNAINMNAAGQQIFYQPTLTCVTEPPAV